LGRGWKGKLTDRLGKRMKRQADRQVREEDENASWQTGSRRGWKGKLTDRLGKRMKRQADRQVREEDENASWQTGSRRGWKGKPGQTGSGRGWNETDKFGKRMKRQGDRQVWEEDERQADRQVRDRDEIAGWQTGSWIVWKNTIGGFIKDEYCSWVQYKSGPGGGAVDVKRVLLTI
jgi:hypothetical protein